MTVNERVYSLVCDGRSDRVLASAISWLLSQHAGPRFRAELVDLSALPDPPISLADRVRVTVEMTECDLLFVHRDAEGQGRSLRLREIEDAVHSIQTWVPVIPIRMTEAWLLFDESAIRTAAGNPAGTAPLTLPLMTQVERASNPKQLLHNALREASGLQGRRLRQLSVNVYRVAELIDNFSPLRGLTAFRDLEADLQLALKTAGWLRDSS